MPGRIASFVFVPEDRCTRKGDHRTLFAPRIKAIVAAAVLTILLVPRPACAQSTFTVDDPIASELAAMGKRGQVIAIAREQTLAILQSENACSACSAKPIQTPRKSSARFTTKLPS